MHSTTADSTTQLVSSLNRSPRSGSHTAWPAHSAKGTEPQ